jgi:hypothetical protein
MASGCVRGPSRLDRRKSDVFGNSHSLTFLIDFYALLLLFSGHISRARISLDSGNVIKRAMCLLQSRGFTLMIEQSFITFSIMSPASFQSFDVALHFFPSALEGEASNG